MWLAETLWQFSCDYYAPRQRAFLALQDHYQLNINLLLLAIFLDRQNLALTTAQWQQLIAHIADSDAELQSMRQHRRNLSRGSEEYQQSLTTELQLEKQQQAACIVWLNQQSEAIPAGAGNLARYAKVQVPNIDKLQLDALEVDGSLADSL